MYKLLIVDDEETIREGLCNIVDWSYLGFNVVQALEDGEDAVEYIRKNSVDIILTDIKMTFMSGLELAKYVCDNQLPIKVVIISGYKEFEFARQAMDYNVKHYLLKPTRLEELKRVFLELKHEMDKEIYQKEKMKKENQQHQELLTLSQEQFFTDLIMGALVNKEDIDKRLKKIGLDISPASSKISVINLNLSDCESYNSQMNEYGNDSLYYTLRNYIINANGNIQYFTIYHSNKNIQVLAVSLLPIENDVLHTEIKSYIQRISSKMKVIIGMDIHWEIERTFKNLYETAIHFKPIYTAGYGGNNKIEEVLSPEDYSHLVKQQKLILAYIKSDNIEMAKNLFQNILDELKFMDKKIIQNYIISLFAILRNELTELGIDMSSKLFDYEVIFKLSDIVEAKQWGCVALSNIADYLKKHKVTSEKKVIQKAKEYINCNYDKDIGLEEVADSVFLSSIYFSRLFKQQTNENFIDYLVKVRISKAMALLQDASLKVYEVSIRVGYKNTKYFYKLFKENTGYTPLEYRENAAMKGDCLHE